MLMFSELSSYLYKISFRILLHYYISICLLQFLNLRLHNKSYCLISLFLSLEIVRGIVWFADRLFVCLICWESLCMCMLVIYVWEGILSGETTSESDSVVSFVSFLISCESLCHNRGWASEVGNFFMRLLSIPPVSQQLCWAAAMKGHGRKADLLDIEDQTLGGIWASSQRPRTRHCHQHKAGTKGRAHKVALAIKQTGWQTFLVGIYVYTHPLSCCY